MTPKGKPSARKDNIVIQHIDNETLVYDLTKNKAYCLNETSALVWRECNGTLSADEISGKLSKNLKSPVSEDIVWLALSQFKKDGLLEDTDEIVTPFDGMSRREVVKRVGFASAVALPVISSLMAPSAVNAQSQSCGCFAAGNMANLSNPGCVCSASSDCCSGSCGIAGPFCLANTNPVTQCCPSINCPPQNAQGIPPGCGCGNNSNCQSGNCMGNICGF